MIDEEFDDDARLEEFILETAAKLRNIRTDWTASQISRRIWALRQAGTTAAFCDVMITKRFGKWVYPRPGRRGGRPAKIFRFHGAARPTGKS